MSDVINKFAPVVGRILLSIIFLKSGIAKIGGFAATAGSMASKGLPMVEVLLVITIIIEIGASVMLIVGWKARWGAAALFLWMIPVTFVYHNYWAMPADQQYLQSLFFFKNLAMMGGMLYITAFGSGPYSVARD